MGTPPGTTRDGHFCLRSLAADRYRCSEPMTLKEITEDASKSGAKLYRNQCLLAKSIEAIGSGVVPEGALETVDQEAGADAVLYDNQVVLLEAIRGVIQSSLPAEKALKGHISDGPSAAAANQAILYANLRLLANVPEASLRDAVHRPLQMKQGQTSYAYITFNQQELLSLIRAHDPSKFVVVR